MKLKSFFLSAVKGLGLASCCSNIGDFKWSDWSRPIKGLQIRGRYIESKQPIIEIELKNVSLATINVFDFRHKPPEWLAPASYFRSMLIGLKNEYEPKKYHLLSKHIFKIVPLASNESYILKLDLDISISGAFQFVYDTSIVERWWPLEYWKGRLESPLT